MHNSGFPVKILYTVSTQYIVSLYIILWYVDPLLGNDREISKYRTAVAK
jgi:hypothetical protein